jgi:hypothetical protein
MHTGPPPKFYGTRDNLGAPRAGWLTFSGFCSCAVVRRSRSGNRLGCIMIGRGAERSTAVCVCSVSPLGHSAMSRDTVHGCPTTSVDERYRQSRRRPARRDSPHLLQEACAVNRPVSSSGVAPMAQVVLRRCRGRNGRPAPSQRYARAMHHRSAVEQCASRVPGSPVLMARRYVAKPVSNRERAGKPRNGSPLADPCAAATAGWPVPTWTTASSTSSGTETARRVGSWPPAGPPPS